LLIVRPSGTQTWQWKIPFAYGLFPIQSPIDRAFCSHVLLPGTGRGRHGPLSAVAQNRHGPLQNDLRHPCPGTGAAKASSHLDSSKEEI